MGLISAGLNALGGTLASQWKEYFYCDSMPVDVLATKAMKRTNGRFGGSKTEDDNVISEGSVIVVNEGQAMIIVDQGQIVDFCAEPGEYKFEMNGEPSIFYGAFNTEKAMTMLKQTFDRFSFGGQAGKDQRVYYFNLKELTGNKYGTPSGVPFLVIDKNVGLYQEINIRCFGEYSYRIVNPMLFYKNVCNNVTGDFTRDQIDGQLKSELLMALGEAFAKISEKGVRYSALPGHGFEIAEELNKILSSKWSEKRGIEIVEFGISSVKASEEDEAMIKQIQHDAMQMNREMQRASMLTDPAMAAAYKAAAESQAMQDAAKNSAGASVGFMGMNMAMNAGGTSSAQLFQMAQQQQMQQASQQAAANSWTCSCGAQATGKFCPECGSKKPEPQTGWKCACGATATGKFCPECGSPKPADEGWTCSCGAVNKGKFCAECGSKKPAGAPIYQCDKCGWKPADPTKMPKFCPECGDVFDENDVQ